MNLYNIYLISYTIIVATYLTFRNFSVFCQKKIYYPEYPCKISIIIPSFNENPELLRQCVKSCYEAKGEKEIMVVDDGSENPPEELLKKLKKRYNIKYYLMPKNKGKRHAQEIGVKKSKGDIIVTIDSDTVIEKDGLIEICKPFNDPEIAAVTGFTTGLNKDKNILTRLINARYISAFMMERESQSTYGLVNCCTGSFSAYRAKTFKQLLKLYVEQKFLGKPCNFGDDRHLTNLTMEQGHKIVFAKNAKAQTYIPETMRAFIKQSLRWQQSALRENLVTMRYMLKRSLILSFDITMATIFPLFSLLIRLSMVYLMIFYPISILYFIVMIIFMAVFRNIPFLFQDKKIIFYNTLYGFIHTFVIYWLYFPALIKVFIQKNRAWGTR